MPRGRLDGHNFTWDEQDNIYIKKRNIWELIVDTYLQSVQRKRQIMIFKTILLLKQIKSN